MSDITYTNDIELPVGDYYYTATAATTSEPAKMIFINRETQEVITLELK